MEMRRKIGMSVFAAYVVAVSGIAYWTSKQADAFAESTAYYQEEVSCTPKEGSEAPTLTYQRNNRWYKTAFYIPEEGTSVESRFVGIEIREKSLDRWIELVAVGDHLVYNGIEYKCNEMNSTLERLMESRGASLPSEKI